MITVDHAYILQMIHNNCKFACSIRHFTVGNLHYLQIAAAKKAVNLDFST